MKIPLDVLHIPDIPTTTSKVSLAGIKNAVIQLSIVTKGRFSIYVFGNSFTILKRN